MASATELLKEAQELTQVAEELDAQVAARTEQFEREIAADRAKAEEAKAEAARKIAEAARAMGSGVRVAPSRRGRRGGIDENAVLAFLRQQREPVAAAAIGQAVGASGSGLSNKLKTMTDAGLIKRQGERRGTRYSAA